jgi:hypothetical protein
VVTAVLSTLSRWCSRLPAAYAITRYRTPSGRVFVVAALVTWMVPTIAVGAPWSRRCGSWASATRRSPSAIAHTTISLPLSIWLMASFFEAVPDELEEAAKVDGASALGALWRVVLPVVSGGLAVTAIFAFLASWNEFLFSLLLTSVRAQTTPIVIANFQTQFGLDWGGHDSAGRGLLHPGDPAHARPPAAHRRGPDSRSGERMTANGRAGVGIRDVAELAGVSVTTVSHVLNDTPQMRVAPETESGCARRRRRSATARTGWRGALRTNRSGLIGLLSEEIATTPHAARIILGRAGRGTRARSDPGHHQRRA